MITGPELVVTGIGLAAGAIATYVGLRLVPIEQHLESRRLARDKEAEALDRRLDGLHDDAKENDEKFEKRLAAIEQTFISRAELERAVNAIGARMDQGVGRVEAGMKDLGTKVDHLTERLTRVEAVG